MSYYIFLDSSNVDLNVGVLKDSTFIKKVSYPAWQKQSELLVDELNKIIQEANIGISMVKGVVTTIGPGSYTGIRISITVAKVISLALNVPVYEISSLHSLCDFDSYCISIINARSNRSYVGIYYKNECLLKDCVLKNSEVDDLVSSHPDYKVCGDTRFLSIQGEKVDVLMQMSHIFPFISPKENSIGVKPVYLKETYDTKI